MCTFSGNECHHVLQVTDYLRRVVREEDLSGVVHRLEEGEGEEVRVRR